MNEQVKAGADIHAGDGGYSIGTQESYEEFARERNRMMKDTIEMAREAGWWTVSRLLKVRLERFEALARADEREACAKVCENWTQTPETTGMELALCAAAIRARGKTK
jgi:hypothetical protein